MSKVEMVGAVPWRKSDDDAKMEGERLKKEVVVMDGVQGEDGDGGARSSAEEVVCTSHTSLLRGTACQAHTRSCRKRVVSELKDTTEEKAANR